MSAATPAAEPPPRASDRGPPPAVQGAHTSLRTSRTCSPSVGGPGRVFLASSVAHLFLKKKKKWKKKKKKNETSGDQTGESRAPGSLGPPRDGAARARPRDVPVLMVLPALPGHRGVGTGTASLPSSFKLLTPSR